MNQLPRIAFEAAPASTRAAREPLSTGNNIGLITSRRRKISPRVRTRALSLCACMNTPSAFTVNRNRSSRNRLRPGRHSTRGFIVSESLPKEAISARYSTLGKRYSNDGATSTTFSTQPPFRNTRNRSAATGQFNLR